MLDASGRIPQAITQKNVYDLGMYDQCLNVYEKTDDIIITGKYCLGGLIIPLEELTEVVYLWLTFARSSYKYLFL